MQAQAEIARLPYFFFVHDRSIPNLSHIKMFLEDRSRSSIGGDDLQERSKREVLDSTATGPYDRPTGYVDRCRKASIPVAYFNS